MADISRASLFGKLNDLAYKSLENAFWFCDARKSGFVELIHWVHQVLQFQDSDLHRLATHFEIDLSRLASDVIVALEKLPHKATHVTEFSGSLEEAVKQAWLHATLAFGESRVRTGHLVVAILKEDQLKHVFTGISREFQKIKLGQLSEEFTAITKNSPEEAMSAHDGFDWTSQASASEASSPPAMGRQEALRKYAVDLTERARKGLLDPVKGRDREISEIIEILQNRRQNNPILTGEAGVGKTAIVEGLAQQIVAGKVPTPLQNVSIWALDLTLLQAGASMKGEFENRLRQLIEEVETSSKSIILFIDEAHTLVGAGNAPGQGDAANLLKPALARGTLRTIAATTWMEYMKTFGKDGALKRRFKPIQVGQPSEGDALLMMRGLVSTLKKHHGVQILDEALVAAVKLSHRYIPDRQLPDKAISLLDTASARVAVSQDSVPSSVTRVQSDIDALKLELELMETEIAVGTDKQARKQEVLAGLEDKQAALAQMQERWNREKELVGKVLELSKILISSKVAAANPTPVETPENSASAPVRDLSEEEKRLVLNNLKECQKQLRDLQGESPLVLPSVDAQAVASVVADWTGIPVGRMVKNEIEAVLNLPQTLEKRVLGQSHALAAIAKRLETHRAGLLDPRLPIGVFLLAGPSGVGKTETALAIAEALYGGEHNLVTINMSEYQESHSSAKLKGAPPGYVGYEEGGVLTNAVLRKPYSVILLDEVEKAHSDVHKVFLQVFDKGMLEDGKGQKVDFKNSIILLTTNLGDKLICDLCKDPELMPAINDVNQAIFGALRTKFAPEFIGRVDVIPYFPISDMILRDIIKLQLSRIASRLMDVQGVKLEYDQSVVDMISGKCKQTEVGARVVSSLLRQTVLPDLSRECLMRMSQGRKMSGISLCAENNELKYLFHDDDQSAKV